MKMKVKGEEDGNRRRSAGGRVVVVVMARQWLGRSLPGRGGQCDWSKTTIHRRNLNIDREHPRCSQ